ncbi:MAG: APC family permease [Acidobacteriaceae bacterium]|nr:APC family permease [Acidobacteriaceae bacterium]
MSDTYPALRKELGLRDLVLFNVAAIVSTRWIGAAAHVGSGTILLWVAAAIFFLAPSAFVVAHLSRMFPEEGGLYVWTREAFGEWHGFSCAWFYYLTNIFWLPGALVAPIGMMTYGFSRSAAELAENPRFVIPCALAVLTGIVASNYVGLRTAKWVDNLGAIGAYSIWIVIVFAALASSFKRGAASTFHLIPGMNLEKLNFWSQLALGMVGLELSPILAGEIHHARRTVFRATWISALLVVIFYVFGTGAILALLPPEQVSPVIGVAQASRQAAVTIGWSWVPVCVGFGILFSLGGQLGTYIGGSARLPFVLGVDNLFPRAFARLHPKYGTPYIAILFLGVGAAVLLLLSQLGETFRAAYQITVDMTVITQFVPFLYLFATAWKFGRKIAAACGLVVSTIAIVFSFLPTGDVASIWLFEAKLAGGCVFVFAGARACYSHYRARQTVAQP